MLAVGRAVRRNPLFPKQSVCRQARTVADRNVRAPFVRLRTVADKNVRAPFVRLRTVADKNGRAPFVRLGTVADKNVRAPFRFFENKTCVRMGNCHDDYRLSCALLQF